MAASGAPITVSIASGHCRDGITRVQVSVNATSEGVRQASDIVCVLDVSGTMGNEATIVGTSGQSESDGPSLLDVAKQGVRTMVNVLNDNDRLSIVVFNHAAQVVLHPTAMDRVGQKEAEESLNKLNSGGGTSIWAGLLAGMDALRGTPSEGRPGHVMLLTGGESQDRENIVPNMLKYKQQHAGFPGTIDTFGFGHNLDSRLLLEMSRAGSGSYCFIPDAGFVGTCFLSMLIQRLVTIRKCPVSRLAYVPPGLQHLSCQRDPSDHRTSITTAATEDTFIPDDVGAARMAILSTVMHKTLGVKQTPMGISKVPVACLASRLASANHIFVADSSDTVVSPDDAPTPNMLTNLQRLPSPFSCRNNRSSSWTDAEHTARLSCPSVGVDDVTTDFTGLMTNGAGDRIRCDGSSLNRRGRGEQAAAGKDPQQICVLVALPDQPKTAKADSKICHFNKPMSESDVQRVIPEAALRKSTKEEAKAKLQWLITSGNVIDWDEVRKLRRIVAE